MCIANIALELGEETERAHLKRGARPARHPEVSARATLGIAALSIATPRPATNSLLLDCILNHSKQITEPSTFRQLLSGRASGAFSSSGGLVGAGGGGGDTGVITGPAAGGGATATGGIGGMGSVA